MQYREHPPLILLSEPRFDGEAIVMHCNCGYEERWPLEYAQRCLMATCQWVATMNAVLFAAQVAREQIEAEAKRDLEAWSEEVRNNLGKKTS